MEEDRPRRLEDATLMYFAGVSANVELIKKKQCGEMEKVEELELLVMNVYSDIKFRVASASCDKNTNAIIETLLAYAGVGILIDVLLNFKKYVKFLALNRHSSHILETVFARLGFIFKNEGIDDGAERDAVTSIIEVSNDLLQSSQLDLIMSSVCGSHVIRSLMCLLVGLPTIQERRSKHAKHQHGIALTVPMENILVKDQFYFNKDICFSVPTEFHGNLIYLFI